MSFDDLFKNLEKATEVANDYKKGLDQFIKEPKNIKKTIEGVGSAIQGGVQAADDALTANPYVGQMYNSAKTGLAGAITLADYQSEKTVNPHHLTKQQLEEKFNPRFQQILKQDAEGQMKYDLAKKGKEEAEKKSKGKQTAAGHWDVLRNSLDETASSALGGFNRLGAMGEEIAEKVGLAKERKYADRVKEGDIAIDRLKRTHKNDDFLAFNQYENFDPETLKYWDPEVKIAFLNKINHPDIDFHEEAQRAKMLREKEASTKILQEQINSGKISREKAVEMLNAQESALGARRTASDLIDDPLNLIDVAEVGMTLGKGLTKKAGKLLPTPKAAIESNIPKIIDDYDPKLTTQMDQYVSLEHQTPELPKSEPLMPSKSKKELVDKYQDTIKQQTALDKSLDNGQITPEEYTHLSEQLEVSKAQSLTDLKNIHGLEAEHILKDPLVHAEEVVQDVKKLNPGITNQDAVKEVMTQKRLLQQEEIVNKSDEIVNKFMSNDGLNPDPIMKNSILNKEPMMYNPPNVSINSKGVLSANPTGMIPPPPVQLEFTNSLQRLLFEFSVPYNKAIGLGSGWKDWNTYKQSMQEIDAVVIQPLAKAIYGDSPTITQINKLKENLGAIKSHVDKEIARRGNTPGMVINIGETGNVNDMISDLIRGNIDNTSRTSTDVGGFYEPATKEDSAVFRKMRDNTEVQIENLIQGHGLTREEAESLVRSAPTVVSSKVLSGPGMSDGLNIAVNEGKMTQGEALLIDKKAAIEHEKLHVSIEHLYQNGVGDILEKKLMAFENAMPPKAGEQYQRFFDLLDPPSERDFVDELSAYIRQYKVAMSHPRGVEVVKQYDALNFIHSNPEMRKELFKWDDMMTKQEALWEVERANIIRNSRMLKPGEIPTRKIDINSYSDNTSSLEAKQFDEVNRQDRLKQLLGPDQMYEDGRVVTYRGEDDLYEPKIQHDSEDAMLGQGHYTSTNLNQASKYTGITGYDGLRSFENGKDADLAVAQKNYANSKEAKKNPQLYEEAIELEKPLFWDEAPKSDIREAFAKSKSESLHGFIDYLSSDPYFIKSNSMGDMIAAISNYADEMGLERDKFWLEFKKEILDPNGYDGMISPPTDNDTMGVEIVSYNLHQVKRKVGKDKYGFGDYRNIEKRKG